MPIDYEIYQKIRRLYLVEKMSQRQIARILHCSRKTVTKYCEGKTTPDAQSQVVVAPWQSLKQSVEPFLLKYLEENKEAHAKQMMTAKSMWERLRKEEGFNIGESTVRELVRRLKVEKPDAFIPLEFPCGTMQVDWGDAIAYIGGKKTRVSILCMVLPFSYAIFAAVFPTKAYESFFMGHQMAFEFFGGVPLECIYDYTAEMIIGDVYRKVA